MTGLESTVIGTSVRPYGTMSSNWEGGLANNFSERPGKTGANVKAPAGTTLEPTMDNACRLFLSDKPIST